MAAAGALLGLSALITVLFPWDRLPRYFRALPPLAYIGVIALMRMGTEAATSTYLPLLLLPLVWLALYGTRGQLIVGFAAAAAVIFLTGASTSTGLKHSLLVVIVTPVVCLTIQRLVSKIRRQALLLEDLTNGDRLTGAITRRAWETTLERELVRAIRTGETLTIGFLDFDAFNKFNERFGADAGDEVLRRSVAAWRRELRAGDLLGRMDGDGFGVALPACTADQAHEVVERLRVATTDLQTCSIGLAQWKKGESTKHFIERALAALAAAKQQGRDRTVVASEPLSKEVEPDEATTSDDVLDNPTLLEEEAATSRSLIAELHAVAEASASNKEGSRDATSVQKTAEETTAASPPETAVAAEPSPPGDEQSPADGTGAEAAGDAVSVQDPAPDGDEPTGEARTGEAPVDDEPYSASGKGLQRALERRSARPPDQCGRSPRHRRGRRRRPARGARRQRDPPAPARSQLHTLTFPGKVPPWRLHGFSASSNVWALRSMPCTKP
jgi:diguanylate cyclase (GGDEF)-like protein